MEEEQILLLHCCRSCVCRVQEGGCRPARRDQNQMALAGAAVEAERSARSGSLAEAPPVVVGESGS